MSRLGTELAADRSLQSADTFLGETRKLQASLTGRDEELKIVHARLSVSEISRVKVERERDSLLVEMQALIGEKDGAVRAMADLEDDLDIALEEARYAAAVRVRDATAKENASRGTTFSFFDGMFLPLDDVRHADYPRPQARTEADQSTNCLADGGGTYGLGVLPPETDEEQVNFGFE